MGGCSVYPHYPCHIPRLPMDVLCIRPRVPSVEDFPRLVISTSLKNSLQRGCLNLTEIVNK